LGVYCINDDDFGLEVYIDSGKEKVSEIVIKVASSITILFSEKSGKLTREVRVIGQRLLMDQCFFLVFLCGKNIRQKQCVFGNL
jgi:hypothetical protein